MPSYNLRLDTDGLKSAPAGQARRSAIRQTMYYWSYRNSHIILSSEEELGLVQELGRNALERVSYHTSHKVRREIESRIFRYLKDSLKADPEAFHRRFVFRSFLMLMGALPGAPLSVSTVTFWPALTGLAIKRL